MHRPHSAPRIALSARHERWVLGLSLALFASGAAWLLAHFLFATADEFGVRQDVSGPWWLRLHGAAAMGFLVSVGTLLPVHVRRAWALKRNRASGATVLAVATLLAASGYALYYAGSEELRPWISAPHWLLGLVAAPALAAHVVLGHRWAARRRRRRLRRMGPAAH